MTKRSITEFLIDDNLSDTADYVPRGKTCPNCGSADLEEQNYGFERVTMCMHCTYSKSKNLDF